MAVRVYPYYFIYFVYKSGEGMSSKSLSQNSDLTLMTSNTIVFPGFPNILCASVFFFFFQKDPVSSLENLEEKKFSGEASIPSPKPKLHTRDLKKELITWVTCGSRMETPDQSLE